jgi:hypothetical protein
MEVWLIQVTLLKISHKYLRKIKFDWITGFKTDLAMYLVRTHNFSGDEHWLHR